MLLEFDLAGAEWVIIAYLCGDKNMIDTVLSGESPHVCTGHLMTKVPKALIEKEQELLMSATDPDLIREVRQRDLPELLDNPEYFLPRTMTIRQMGKKSNHGLNYNLKYRYFALVNEIEEKEAAKIVDFYNHIAYPGLTEWRGEIKKEFRDNGRMLTNLMGRRVRLLDKPGDDLWNAIYAFKPQSTVADIIRDAIIAVYNDTSELARPMRLLAPVHDSILLNYPHKPMDRLLEFAKLMKKYMTVELEARGVKFTLGVDLKGGHNWGAMAKIETF